MVYLLESSDNMFKYKENYILTNNNKDIGKITLYSIVLKKYSNIKRRYHQISKSYIVNKYLK